MSRPFQVYPPSEHAYERNVLFALELLDSATLMRVSQGLKVVAHGLHGAAIINNSGLFVWLHEDISALKMVSIDPGTLPYEHVELSPGELQLPEKVQLRKTTVLLPIRMDYSFTSGITGLRGTLVETAPAPQGQPVADAKLRLRWLEDDGVTWHDAPGFSSTNSNGDFTAVLRFVPTDVPRLDAAGQLTVRLRVQRPEQVERETNDLKLVQGQVADPIRYANGGNALTFIWDELHL